MDCLNSPSHGLYQRSNHKHTNSADITHKLHTNEMHCIFTFYYLTPTYVSAFIRPSSGGS
jgi:hypothetical protein